MDAFVRKTRSIADRYNITVLGGRYLDVWKRGALPLLKPERKAQGHPQALNVESFSRLWPKNESPSAGARGGS